MDGSRVKRAPGDPDIGPARYVGPDRRAGDVGGTGPDGRPFIVAGVELGLAWLGSLGAGSAWQRLPNWVDAQRVNLALSAVSVVLAAVVGIVYVMRWRLVGDTASLRVGVAVALLAAGDGFVHVVLPALSVGFRETLSAGVWLATSTVVVVLLVRAITNPPIDTAVRPSKLLGRVLVSFTALIVLFAVIPAVIRGLRGGTFSSGLLGEVGSGAVLVAFAWLVLATVYTVAGLRQSRWLYTWFGLMLLGLAMASIARAASASPGDLRATGAALTELLGMGFALFGAAEELRRAWSEQQGRLLDVQAEFEIHRARSSAEIARYEERAHDAKSMLLAIQSAALGLERGIDDLDPDLRVALTRGLATEAERLQKLVGSKHPPPRPTEFDVAQVLGPIATLHRTSDLGFSIELPPGLRAVGVPDLLGEAVQNLLDNARVHAPGSPVSLSACRQLGNVVIRVDDRGPGVDPSERELIFDRGRRGSNTAAEGTGLGLHVARNLMREQGGDLWVEGRPGGGASFVLFLSAVSSGTATPAWGTEAPDEIRDPVEVLDRDSFDMRSRDDRPFAEVRRQANHHGSGDTGNAGV